MCEDFRIGKIWALICTDLFARGIDFKGVKLVINYDFPSSMINYIHRVGRTGRAGREGSALTFYTDADKCLLRSLGNVLNISGCKVPEWIFTLKNT
jgi:ATP-dependent RNA helicase DDX52/ROK1